jgi:hypothetical protein
MKSTDIVNYWKKLPKTPPFIHPDDHIPHSDLVQFASARKALFDDRVYFEEKAGFHSGLLPSPYIGDLARARIVVLLLNPGFSPLDYKAEEDSKYLQAQKENLIQEFPIGRRRFFPLDARFAWTGAGEWWRKKLKPIVEVFRENGVTLSEALDILSDNLVAIEYWPYHSRSNSLRAKNLDACNSHKIAAAFVHSYYLERSPESRPLIVVLRAANRWNIKKSSNVIIFEKKFAQSASLKSVAIEIYRVLTLA